MSTLESLGLNAKQWQFLNDTAVERYVEASRRSGRELRLESTRRQFLAARVILARLNGSQSQGEKARRGILLADDVGLGKTTVAALVAWVVASAEPRRKVRILAPNDVVRRNWVKELGLHVGPLQECARRLGVHPKQVKDGGGPLNAGWIRVVNHAYARANKLHCDLLIVDEAHRAKGKDSEFSKQLMRKGKDARRILILTATPFSIDVENELLRMLRLIGADGVKGPVREYEKALDRLYQGTIPSNREGEGDRLAARAKAAVEALKPYVIRHGVEDLPSELDSFGQRDEWNIEVPKATAQELELILRLVRALTVENKDGSRSSNATNDARFHQGWSHYAEESNRANSQLRRLAEPARHVVGHHLHCIERLRVEVGIHSKIRAVAAAVEAKVWEGEKVVLFCDFHATAEELTTHLYTILPQLTAPQTPRRSAWKQAWNDVLQQPGDERDGPALRETFINWLCGDLIRAQTCAWFRPDSVPLTDANLANALRTNRARHSSAGDIIAAAGQRLYEALLKSRSSHEVLRLAEEQPEQLLSKNGAARVLGICGRSNESVFLHNRSPDTAIAIFNSPFGPDVLVGTDKLSEGIDLHRYCRCLVHYELDPSPIRAVQREGRIRRVNSWAAATGKPILYAYPAFPGTRDEQLVRIVQKRVANFSLLLGGVQGFRVEAAGSEEEEWRNEVIEAARDRLTRAGNQLRAQEPGGP